MQEYSKYFYDGPVLIFDKIATDHWHGETMAPSENRARTNLAYQFKKKHDLVPGAKVNLPGQIKKIN